METKKELTVSERRSKVIKIIEEFDKSDNNNTFPNREFILERKNLADKKRNLAMKIKKHRDEMELKIVELSNDFLKLEGIIEYVEKKIVGQPN